VRSIALMIVLLPLSTLAQAQEEPSVEPAVTYKSVTEIEFETQDLDGVVTRPNIEYVMERTEGRFPPLIQIRDDFNAELTESISRIK